MFVFVFLKNSAPKYFHGNILAEADPYNYLLINKHPKNKRSFRSSTTLSFSTGSVSSVMKISVMFSTVVPKCYSLLTEISKLTCFIVS